MRPTLSTFLLAASLTGCASGGVTLPEVGTIIPEAGADAVSDRCGDLLGMQSKWARKLRMEDWRVTIVCRDIPDSESAWALSYIETTTREIGVIVDPDAPDIEETVLHELLHGILENVIDANSDHVSEQAVRVLAEMGICRERKGEQ